MMICRSCGAANPPDTKNCRVCGRPPSADPALTIQPAEDRVPAPAVLRQPAQAAVTAGPPTSTLAIVSLVAGVAAWVLAPVVGTVVAIVCGHLALREIESSGRVIQGRGLALAGLLLGYAQIAVAALVLLGVCVFFAVTFFLVQSAALAG